MKPSRLSWPELIGVASAVILAVSIFLPWFSTELSNPNSQIDGMTGSISAWQALKILRWVLLAVCIPPLVLAYMVLRAHEVGWNRGEVTAVIGVTGFIIILSRGIIFGQPGTVEVSLSWGYPIAALAALGVSAGGLMRQSESVEKTPPGV